MQSWLLTLAQYNSHYGQSRSDGSDAVALLLSCCCYGILFLSFIPMFAGLWKIFVKAGKPGWAAIVPVYNLIVLLEIVNRPIWWIVWFLIPCLSAITGLVFGIILAIDLAKAFGKDALYGLGLALLPWAFYPMLGFGSAQYQGPPARDPGQFI